MNKLNISCQGKNAIVCGSTDGIGKACALVLAEQGASITLIARNEQKLAATLDILDTRLEQKHCYIVADFSEPEILKSKAIEYLKDGKATHILVNNTGAPKVGRPLEAKPSDFIEALNQHLICAHLLSQVTIPGMKKVGYGRIINITSYSAKQPLNDMIVSNTIKGAVSSWAKTMANILGSYGITVNNILPGSTGTRQLFSFVEERAVMTGKSKEEILGNLESLIPVGRLAKPEEVAWAVAFIASPAAAYINGINLPVDGGKTKSL